MLALRTRRIVGSSSEPSHRIGRHELLLRRHAGLRADVWHAIDVDAERFDQVVGLEHFVPHEPGPALYKLETELDLARELNHDNIARTLEIGFEEGRHFIIKEHLEGATLETLLRCQSLAGARLPTAAAMAVLLGVLSAVGHAERVSRSVGAKVLSRQPLELGDVFVTHDGQVKVLGFKMPLRAEVASTDAALTAASVVALLFEHVTSELQELLTRASGAKVRPCDRLAHVRQVLLHHPSASDGSGRRELVALMAALPSSVRVEPRVRLAAAFDSAARSGRIRARPLVLGSDDPAPPTSGVRPIDIAAPPESMSESSARLPCPPAHAKEAVSSVHPVWLVCACLVLALTSFLVTQ
jgi:hypothetical protein